MRGRIVAAGACIAVVAGIVVPSAAAHPGPVVPPAVSPGAALSTSGDYASDVLGDPWDFSNGDDVPATPGVGCQGSAFINCNIFNNGGELVVGLRKGTIIKLIRNWGKQVPGQADGLELPYGHDGLARPADAGRYSILSFAMCNSGAQLNLGVRFSNETGSFNQVPFAAAPGCQVHRINLAAGPYQIPGGAAWAGAITRLDIISGGQTRDGGTAADPEITVSLDWARLHRPDTPDAPPAGVPVARTVTPSELGGTDYATATGNPWDMSGPNDVLALHDVVGANYAGGQLNGVISGNDSFVEFPIPAPFDPDRYHRFSARLCVDGPMGRPDLDSAGMLARVAWFGDAGTWTESQSMVTTPGCNEIRVDLVTDPPVAVHDAASIVKSGWRGQRITRLRLDLSEDTQQRHFWLSNVRFADDPAFATTYPITYHDSVGAGGATADIYATTNRAAFDGVQIAARRPVNGAADNTFTWGGSDVNGNALPNGSYWIYTVIRNGAGVATGYSDAPVRIERALPPTPSTFVPLSPARLLDTRTGIGGNIVALGPDVATLMQVAGRGGVPAAGATAVVLNVTVDHPNSPGVITAWPSGELRPVVSSLNFAPGDVVANLVTVKLGVDGRVALHNLKGNAPLIVDVVGYYTPSGGSRFTPLTPGRLLDTGSANPIGPGVTLDVKVTGDRNVPTSGVAGVALNVTVDMPTASSYFTVYPTGEARPNASTLNFVRGLTVANLTLAKVGAGGQISIWNYDGTARVVVDVVGYFSAQGGRFVPVSPQRIVDSREGLGVPPAPIGAGQTLVAPVVRAGSPVPAGATGAVLNVTSDRSTVQSYLTVFPAGEPRPVEGSTVNPRAGVPVAGHTYAKLGTGGSAGAVDVFNYTGSTDVVIDVFGYIAP